MTSRCLPLSNRLSELANGPSGDYADTLLCIFAESLRAYMKLCQARIDADVQYAAFALRNLLELSIWTLYCSMSKENAARFFQDVARDAVGLVRAIERLPREMLKLTIDLDKIISEARTSLRVLTAKAGIDENDHAYYPVSQAAEAITPGFRTAYVSLNAFLSKLVHPTALSVKMTWPQDIGDTLTSAFLKAGTGVMEHMVTAISAFVSRLDTGTME